MLPQALPQGHFSPFFKLPKNAETRLISGFPSYSGGGRSEHCRPSVGFSALTPAHDKLREAPREGIDERDQIADL
jgi:hypothetical protein